LKLGAAPKSLAATGACEVVCCNSAGFGFHATIAVVQLMQAGLMACALVFVRGLVLGQLLVCSQGIWLQAAHQALHCVLATAAAAAAVLT
jgi:hypothetical protein